jgi:hypothetical protein
MRRLKLSYVIHMEREISSLSPVLTDEQQRALDRKVVQEIIAKNFPQSKLQVYELKGGTN